jgi:hypothetical protein
MLILKENKKNKRNWFLLDVDDSGNLKESLIELNLLGSSITNKFGVVSDLLSDICTNVPDFEPWYKKLLKDYLEQSLDAEIIWDNIEDFMTYIEQYVDSKNIDFSNFSKVEKSSKTSVMFLSDDIRAIAISSTALKLYSIICYDSKIKLPENMHRRVYDRIVKPCVILDVTNKIYQLIRSRTYKSSITDRGVWEIIKLRIQETPESYVMAIFNFLMSNMLSTLSIDKNPIPFIVSIIDDSVRWMMRTVYKDRILYGEVFGGSEDIYGSSVSKESFYLHCCNDVVGKSAQAAISILENEANIEEEQFDAIRDRLEKIEYLTSIMKLLILPIAGKVLEIPYRFLLTAPPKHAMLLGIFLNYLSKNTLAERFPIISEFLLAYPKDPTYSTRSSYRVRNMEFIINDKLPIFGFASKDLKFEVMSAICGVFTANKKNLVNIIDGKAITKISYIDLEHDIIKFYNLLYSNQLESVFKKMRDTADGYF